MYAHPYSLPHHWPALLKQAERAGVRDLEGCAAVPAGDERQRNLEEARSPKGKRALRKAQPRSKKQFLTQQTQLNLPEPQKGAFDSTPAQAAGGACDADGVGRSAFFFPASRGPKNFRGRSSTAYQSHR